MNPVRLAITMFALVAPWALTGCSGELESPGATTALQTPTGKTLAQGRLPFVVGYEAGVAEAQRQNKPLLVFFTAEWCHYCHAMAAEALSQEVVVRIAERFVCVLVDADAEPEVCRQYRVRAYPTVQFLSPTGVPLNRMTGKQPAQQVVMEMQAALQSVARRPVEGARSL